MIRRLLALLLLLLIPASVSAQVGPGQFTIVRTTSTGTSSLLVGCASGVTTVCSGTARMGHLVFDSTGAATGDITFQGSTGANSSIVITGGNNNILTFTTGGSITSGILTIQGVASTTPLLAWNGEADIATRVVVDTGSLAGAMPVTGQFTVKAIHTMTGTTDGIAGFFAVRSPVAVATVAQALYGYMYVNHAAGTTALAQGAIGVVETAGAGTTTAMRAFDAIGYISSTGGGTDMVAYQATMTGRSGGGSGTFTNGYGLKVGTFGAGFTNKYSVFSDDTTATMRNDGQATFGKANTAAGSVSATDSVATTLFATAGATGLYNVFAYIADVGTSDASAHVMCDGTNCRITSDNGAILTITLSGTTVQATQTSGSTQTITYSYLKIR